MVGYGRYLLAWDGFWGLSGCSRIFAVARLKESPSPVTGLRIVTDSGSILNSIEVTVASAQVALLSFELMTTSLLPDESLLAALTESAEVTRGDRQRLERAVRGRLEPVRTAVRRGLSGMQISFCWYVGRNVSRFRNTA